MEWRTDCVRARTDVPHHQHCCDVPTYTHKLIDVNTKRVRLSFLKPERRALFILQPPAESEKGKKKEYQIHWKCNGRHFFPLHIVISLDSLSLSQNFTNWHHINLNLIWCPRANIDAKITMATKFCVECESKWKRDVSIKKEYAQTLNATEDAKLITHLKLLPLF